MNIKKTLVAAVLAAAAPLSANALDFKFDWAAADANIGAANTRPLSNATDELKVTLESVVVFKDVDKSGGISAGDTFRDYLAIRIDQLFYKGDNNGETGLGYGTSREITATGVLTGTQLDPLNYTVNNGGLINIIYDSGLGFTKAQFANLATFVDSNGGAGKVVETGTTVPVSAGTNSPLVPDGNIDLTLRLKDLIERGDFEVGLNGDPFLNLIYGLSDSNNNRCRDSGGTASCGSTTANILALFGAGIDPTTEFAFHTRSDGSIIKVPEPATLALIGMGLLGLGFSSRRKSK